MAKNKAKNCECCCGGVFEKPEEALMAFCILAVASDGKLARSEMDILYQMTALSPLFAKVRDPKAFVACVADTIGEKGRAAAMAGAAAILPPRLAETAYAWAAMMVASDGKTLSPEHSYLSGLRKALGLHGVLAGKINAVVPMLNRVK